MFVICGKGKKRKRKRKREEGREREREMMKVPRGLPSCCLYIRYSNCMWGHYGHKELFLFYFSFRSLFFSFLFLLSSTFYTFSILLHPVVYSLTHSLTLSPLPSRLR